MTDASQTERHRDAVLQEELRLRHHPMRIAARLLMLCGFILCFDVGGELHAVALSGSAYGFPALLHLGGEFLATMGLGWAFVLARAELRRSAAAHRVDRDRLTALRSDFDHLMQQHFARWGLSRAECDIALLTVRGLRIAQIAQLRNTQEGTVKSQLSAIYHKSGVTSRGELLAHFIDEFLDQTGVTGADAAGAAPTVASPPASPVPGVRFAEPSAARGTRT